MKIEKHIIIKSSNYPIKFKYYNYNKYRLSNENILKMKYDMMLRFGCDQYANHCKRNSKSDIPGYYNHN